MKKQLLTGALALSMMLGTTGMAFAAEVPVDQQAYMVNVASEDTSAASMQAVTITTSEEAVDAAQVSEAFKISDMKEHTAESYALEIKNTKAGLEQAVQAKAITQEDADKIIEQMEKDLEQIQAGTLKLYYADMLDKDGNIVGKVSMVNDVNIGVAGELDGQSSIAAFQISVTSKN